MSANNVRADVEIGFRAIAAMLEDLQELERHLPASKRGSRVQAVIDRMKSRAAGVEASLSDVHAAPQPHRLALARALVPGWAVVPREATEAMLVAGAARHRDFLSNQGPYPRTRAVWTAMLTAAEEPPHGP